MTDIAALTTGLATLRRELLAILANTDSNVKEMRAKVEDIISEIERLVRLRDDHSSERPG